MYTKNQRFHLIKNIVERRKRWSDGYKGVPVSDEEDEVDGTTNSTELKDEQLKKEEQELSKIATGIGKVFLKNVQEREKMKQWKAAHLDPRNASRFVFYLEF